MKTIYTLIAVLAALLLSRTCAGQCSISISTDSGSTQLNCKNTEIILKADITGFSDTANRVYSWSSGDNSKSIQVTSGGIYTVTVSNITCGTGNPSSYIASISITKNTTAPTIRIIASADTICNGNSSILRASGADTYVWLDGSTADTLIVSPAGTASYSVTGIDNSTGCTGTGNSTVTVNPLPTANISAVNSSGCQFDTTTKVNFTGSDGTIPYTFGYILNGTNPQSVSTTGSNTLVAVTVPTGQSNNFTYKLTSVSDANRCSQKESDSVTVTIYPKPVFMSATTGKTCSGALYSYTAESSIPGTSFSWKRSAVTGITPDSAKGSDSTINETLVNTTTSPIIVSYVFTYYVNKNCSDSAIVNVTVNPLPKVNPLSPIGPYCDSASATAITFTSPTNGASFSWISSTDVGFGTSGTRNPIPSYTAINGSAVPVKATVSVTATANTCTGPATTFTVTVNPTPVAIVSTHDSVYCNGETVSAISFSSSTPGTTYNWTFNPPIGSPGSGTTNPIPSFTAANTGTAPITATVSVQASARPGCPKDNTVFFPITVNPTPVTSVSAHNSTYCSGTQMNPVTFSATPGATFSWKSNVDVGFGTSGNGSIPSKTATNPGNSPVTATVTVSVSANGCTGKDTSFTITVNPTPVINPISKYTYCNGAIISPITFSSPTPGATFSWKSTKDVGFGTGSSGSIPADTVVNKGTVPDTATVTVSVSANGCTGKDTSFTITVNPTPVINPIPNDTFCNGVTIKAITFSSPTPGATFSWKSNVDVGFGTQGTGSSIATDTAANNGTFPITATVTVSVSANGCTGKDTSFTITVTPAAKTNISPVQPYYCNGTPIAPIVFTNPSPGATFTWTSTTDVGFNTSGKGSIPADTAVNNGTLPDTATVTVYTTILGCKNTIDTSIFVKVNPTPLVNPVQNDTLCGGTVVSYIFTSPTSDPHFKWTSNIDIGFGTGGSGSIYDTVTYPGTATVTAMLTVSDSANGCIGTPVPFSITVTPAALINISPVQPYCNGALIDTIHFSSPTPGTTFLWTSNVDIGFDTSGTGSFISPDTAVNTGTAPDTATITVSAFANGCAGTNRNFTVIVNPTPKLFVSAFDSIYCNGAIMNSINFTSSTPGATFKWTSSAEVGFSTGGSGSIYDTAVNKGNSPLTTTVTAGVLANGCTGKDTSFTITVNPTPVVSSAIQNSYTYCNGEKIRIDSFTSATPGTTFSWKATKDVGFDTSGKGSIPAVAAVNNDTLPVTATVTVSAFANNCAGRDTSFTITVNPTPRLNSTIKSSYTYCNGDTIKIDHFSSATPGATFSWTSNVNIGFGTGSSDSIPVVAAVNNDTLPVTATVTVSAFANNCAGRDTSFTITVNPTPIVKTVLSYTYCNGAIISPITFSSPTPGATFSWTSNMDIGFGRQGKDSIRTDTAVNSTALPDTATVTVSASANRCAGTGTTSFTVIVNPTPVINPISKYTYCNGAATSPITFTSATPGATFSWKSTKDVGFGKGSSGSIPADTAVNNGTLPDTATVTVSVSANGCTGKDTSFTIIVNPTPTLNSTIQSNYTYCNSAATSPITFSSATPGTAFSWTSTPYVGFDTSGSGNLIPADTAVNNTALPVTATFTVSASANSCYDSSTKFAVTVNPTPVVSSAIQNSYTYCNGEKIRIDSFTSATPDSVFTWKSTKDIGFDTSGKGSIPANTAVNNGTLPDTAKITVSISANGCTGRDTSFTITVNPTPVVSSAIQNNYTYCNGSKIMIDSFTSATTGTTFSWTSTKDVGFDTSGKGSIPAVAAVNNDTLPVTATVTVSAFANNCAGRDTSFTITVNPTPRLNSTIRSSYTYCNGAPTSPVTLTSATPGANITWTSTKDVGFGTGSNGSIPTVTAKNNNILPDTATVTVTISANGCSDNSTTFTVIVNPTPKLSVSLRKSTYCSGDTTLPIFFSSSTPGATYTWASTSDIGFGTGGTTSSIPSFPAVDTGSLPRTAIINVIDSANGCAGSDTSFTIAINPIPNTQVSTHRSVYCNGDQMDPINFTSSTPNYSYTWTSSVNIGFGPRSTGSIPPVNAVNMGVSPLTTKIVDSVSANGCPGVKDSFYITVNPTPKINPVQNYTYCDKASAAPIIFTTPTTGGPATYTWTSTKNVGFSTGNNGSIPAFTATNSGVLPDMAKVIVDISVNSCVGAKDSFYVIVNPTPVINISAPYRNAYCNGDNMDTIGFVSATPGANITWTSSADVGFGTSGNGSIPARKALNTGTAPITTTVTVNISANGCVGNSISFPITVNPLPFVPVITSLSGLDTANHTLEVCKSAQRINFNVKSPSSNANLTYLWTSVPSQGVLIHDPVHPNTVIDFDTAVNVKVKVTASVNSVPVCRNSDSMIVKVDDNKTPIEYRKKIVKKSGNILIYPDNRISRFQWGYDQVISPEGTPSPEEGPPVNIAGQVYQFFTPDAMFLKNDTLNTTDFYYWVMLYEGSNGDTCATKVYYNGPFDDKPTNNRPVYQDNSIHLAVFPNPNRGTFKVDLQGNIYGTIEAQLYNASGQLVYRNKFTKTDPVVTKTFITNGLAGGMYYLMLRSSDLKEVHTRFIIIQ